MKLPLDHDESFIQGGRNESENELHGEEREKEDVTKKKTQPSSLVCGKL